jgi:hypothetical protein
MQFTWRVYRERLIGALSCSSQSGTRDAIAS